MRFYSNFGEAMSEIRRDLAEMGVLIRPKTYQDQWVISIHAPVKGATADYPNPSFIILPKMRQRSKPITTLST